MHSLFAFHQSSSTKLVHANADMLRRFKARIIRRLASFRFAVTSFCVFLLFGVFIFRSWSDLESSQLVDSSSRTEKLAGSNCKVIHIMSVVGGHNATFGFSILLKSLLSTRHNPLMLHLLVNNSSKLVLREILDTWLISGLSYKFYDISAVEHLISWIPNIHYSGTFGLLKLLVPHILNDVQKVIVLDTDLLFMDDILPMWKAFEALQAGGRLFGLVENQSDWYLKVTSSSTAASGDEGSKTARLPWPALGRGFNSGLMLMDLAGLCKSGIDWMSLWQSVASRHLETYKYTTLADQDIFNAVFAENPTLVAKLACDWNFQLSYGSKEDHCLANLTSIFRVVHFNHPEKTALLFEYGDGDMDGLFANVYAKAVETNGYYFRLMFTSCPNMELKYSRALDELSPADACYEIRLETVTVRRLFPFFFSGRLGKPKEKPKISVSLVTQLSFERISQLELVCRSWSGPISAAIYLSDADLVPLIRLLLDDSSCLSSNEVHVHLVFRHGTTYPVNFLRNIALKFAQSSHVLMLDADFLPSPSLDAIVIEHNEDILKLEKTALVIPAFDVSSFVDLSLPKDETKIDKTALLDLIDRGLAQPFQSIKWPVGHGPTNFTRWKTSDKPYEVKWAPDYEPYVLIPRLESPSFDERFVGFGWNKVSFTMQLDALGYRFLVHPSTFVLHLPHLPSLDLMRFRSNSLYQTCLENFKLEFVNELASKHGASALKYLKAMPGQQANTPRQNQ